MRLITSQQLGGDQPVGLDCLGGDDGEIRGRMERLGPVAPGVDDSFRSLRDHRLQRLGPSCWYAIPRMNVRLGSLIVDQPQVTNTAL